MPCIPTRATKAPSGERWVHEIKHDGFRLIARKVNGRVHLFTKGGHDYASRYTLIVETLSKMRVKSIALDGEVVCETFDHLWSGSFDHRATLAAFDLLELNGTDYRSKPLVQRKKRLAKLLAKDRPGIEYVDHLAGDGAVIFEHACKLGLEGIVSKRIDLSYQPGPSKVWLKIKNRDHPSIQRVRDAFEAERQKDQQRRTTSVLFRSGGHV